MALAVSDDDGGTLLVGTEVGTCGLRVGHEVLLDLGLVPHVSILRVVSRPLGLGTGANDGTLSMTGVVDASEAPGSSLSFQFLDVVELDVADMQDFLVVLLQFLEVLLHLLFLLSGKLVLLALHLLSLLPEAEDAPGALLLDLHVRLLQQGGMKLGDPQGIGALKLELCGLPLLLLDEILEVDRAEVVAKLQEIGVSRGSNGGRGHLEAPECLRHPGRGRNGVLTYVDEPVPVPLVHHVVLWEVDSVTSFDEHLLEIHHQHLFHEGELLLDDLVMAKGAIGTRD